MARIAALTIGVTTLLQACSGASVKQQEVPSVTSTPSGAAVYANAKQLGVTPLHYRLHTEFPAVWKNMMFQAQGVLMLKLDGCEDYMLEVNDYVLSRPIHAELDCGEGVGSEVSAKENREPAAVEGATDAGAGSGVESRLRQLEDLFNRGIINESEYKTTRERILNEL